MSSENIANIMQPINRNGKNPKNCQAEKNSSLEQMAN